MTSEEWQNELTAARNERDALKIEYESRVIWMRNMCDIIGYNNDDGFHCTPSPHDIAKRLVEERDASQKEVEREIRLHQAIEERLKHQLTTAQAEIERLKQELSDAYRNSQPTSCGGLDEGEV